MTLSRRSVCVFVAFLELFVISNLSHLSLKVGWVGEETLEGSNILQEQVGLNESRRRVQNCDALS